MTMTAARLEEVFMRRFDTRIYGRWDRTKRTAVPEPFQFVFVYSGQQFLRPRAHGLLVEAGPGGVAQATPPCFSTLPFFPRLTRFPSMRVLIVMTRPASAKPPGWQWKRWDMRWRTCRAARGP